jgi:hypothetical protein
MMKKLFVSQIMRGKTQEEILTGRSKLVKIAQAVLGEDLEVLDSYFKDFDGNRVKALGKSITLLAEADCAIFEDSWDEFPGCLTEHNVCRKYGIPIITYSYYEGSPRNEVEGKGVATDEV